MKKIILGTALAIVAAAPALAQPNPNLRPFSGTLTLGAGFSGDPRTIPVTAGGGNDLNLSEVRDHCTGYISDRPDFRLNYRAGDGFPLIFSVDAPVDTTLVVNGPDGRWYCNDDRNSGDVDPAIRFTSPQSGQYDVWIGTFQRYEPRDLPRARLFISEVRAH